MTPKGVEHQSSPCEVIGPGVMQAVMPKGVEHRELSEREVDPGNLARQVNNSVR